MTSEKFVCPSCGSQETRIRNTYRAKRTDGIRRTIICHKCANKWTVWVGEKPPTTPRTKYPERDPLTEEQVREILLNRTVPHLKMGKRFNRSRSTIQKVRNGLLHANLAPEISRWDKKAEYSCTSCKYWKNESCWMDIAEAKEEGVYFANECALYEACD